MSRPLRIEYPNAIYHITSRGNAQANIFLDHEDRELFLKTLEDVIKRFGWLCHAYCLMDNHYHLMVETPQSNLCSGMRQLNGVYTQRFNRAHQRVGHVFQGRYKSILVERDVYLLELCRYVVLNPVRAKMVGEANQWSWSSYAATAGLVECPNWLSVRWLLSQFSHLHRADAYARFVVNGMKDGCLWDGLNQQVYLGGDAFVDEVKSLVNISNDLSEIPRVQWKSSGKGLDDYEGEGQYRNDAMARAFLEGEFRMNEIAAHFGVHYSTVSRAVKKMEMLDCKT
jgi:REP element-mobilizing transposase RayT